jgi:hypothetical protein
MAEVDAFPFSATSVAGNPPTVRTCRPPPGCKCRRRQTAGSFGSFQTRLRESTPKFATVTHG